MQKVPLVMWKVGRLKLMAFRLTVLKVQLAASHHGRLVNPNHKHGTTSGISLTMTRWFEGNQLAMTLEGSAAPP